MGSTNTFEDFKPREYQVEMLETAIKRNTIVFMPTGSGKTFIAAMLIKHMARDIEKPYSNGGMRTFFLVNTVALVTQQAESIARMLPLEISTYSGDMGVDYWDQSRWLQELEKNQVLVMTAQIFLNLLTHSYIKMSRVNLLIMDECHHTMRNHAMNQIMKLYRSVDCTERPRILGLTATLLNANCKIERIDHEIKTLETNMDSTVITATDEELVQLYSTNPKEEILRYSSQASSIGSNLLQTCITSLTEAINSIDFIEPPIISPVEGAELLSDSKKTLNKRLVNMLLDLNVLYKDLGFYAAAECALAMIVRLERIKLSTTDSVLSTLLEIMITKLHYFRNRAFKLMEGSEDITDNKKPLIYSSTKLRTLCDFFKNYNPENVSIVFVERRLTAKVLFYIFSKLSKTNSMFRGIKPDFIVGFNSNPYNDTREVLYMKKSNLTTLRKFNSKEINVLFASNVIEEGIDIRICNYVIKFDLPQTFRSYIQSKGRARNKNSTFLLIMPDSDAELSNYYLFKATENYMKKNLHCGKAQIYLQTKEETNEIEDFNLPPYFVDGPGSATVTGLSAISLVNRYCLSLPQDRFCPLTSYWWVKEVTVNGIKKHKGILQLPVNSAIKSVIEGPSCDSKINAKRGVALEACKLLHQFGELDTNLLPCGKYSELLNDKKLFPHWQVNEPKAGTKKLKRSYNKRYSKWECGCRPRPDIDIYLHFLRVTPNYEKPLKTRLVAFFDILNSKTSFSILTSKKWPKICQFPMFMNVGEVNVKILENVKTFQFTKDEINLLFRFHCFLFTEVLRFSKKFVMRDYDNLENAYFIVPTIEGKDGEISIDWETIKEHKKLPEMRPLSNDARENLVVDEETYLGKVVVPWYRPQGDTMRYIVTKVCQDERPDSPFPSANYESYAQYFYQRYNQKLLNPTQPLIEVRAISSKLNCLLPKGKRQSSRRKRLEEDDFEETLIPELCCLLGFPSVYMLKATVLPSVLHRIHHLLIAEELRRKIAVETKLGTINISPGNVWESLKLDITAIQYDDKPQAHSTIEVSDMLTSSMNALKEGEFPWKEEEEPFDVERQLLNVDLLAIIHYQNFMTGNELQHYTISRNGPSSKPMVLISPPKASLSVLNNVDKSTGPEQHAILQALTAISATDIINNERLETLGDSFLKFIVSLALFIYYPDKDEGKLTQVKGKIIGNKNFFFVGSNISLGSLLKVHDFSPNDWDVPCFSISRDFKNIIKYLNCSPPLVYQICLSPWERDSGIFKEDTRLQLHDLMNHPEENDGSSHSSLAIIGQHSVPDKTISDAVEALVGVYLQACGITGALTLCQWLGILAPEISGVTKLFNSPAPTARLNAALNMNYFLVEPERLEATIGYKFEDRSFLLQALTHASFQTNVTDCYQRLEFLGDAILDFLITAHIYENCGNLSPGELTDLRSALVNNVTFACLSVRYGFHKHLNARSSKLNEIILRFVKHQESRDHKIGAEVLFLIEEQNAQVAESIDVPKLLGDLFESIAAAIYLDSGKSLQKVWNVYFNLMKKEIEAFSKNVPKNHIRLLYEKFPSPPPKFGKAELLADDRVLIPLEVIHNSKPSMFHGIGENKLHAKLAAAKMALRFFHEKYQDV